MIAKYLTALSIGLILAYSAITYYLYQDNRKLAESKAELKQAIELVAQRDAAAQLEKYRLQQMLEERQLRERVAAQRTQQLREQINALSNDCILSDDAGRVLQQIYERHRTM